MKNYLLWILAISSFASPEQAQARAPETQEESALLYWRYRCREQPQTELMKKGTLELSCLSQKWKVHANGRTGKVMEVILADEAH